MRRIGMTEMLSVALLGALCARAEAAPKGTPYQVEGKYYETCGCVVSCPCATNKFLPSEGHCDAVMSFHIDKGTVGKTKLDGINFAGVIRSPKNQIVGEAFAKGEMDHMTFYFDDKASAEQKEAMGQLIPALFGDAEIKGFKAPQWVPMSLTVDGDVAKFDAGGGKLSYEIENLDVGMETKDGAPKAGKAEKKRIQLTNSAPFPFIANPTQGRSHAFHYDDYGVKWDYKDRNAFFSTFKSKGVTKAAAARPPAEKATEKAPEKADDKAAKKAAAKPAEKK
jgi:hypothetical protein